MRWFLILFLFIAAHKATAENSPDELNIRAILVAGEEVKPDSIYVISEEKNTLIIWLEVSERPVFSNFGYFLNNKEGQKRFQSDSLRIAISALPAGQNRIELFGIKSNGEMVKIHPLTFKVNKIWFRSTWFWALCLFMLLGAFFGSERFLKKYEEEEEKYQKQVAHLELRTLQLQMNPHFVFNALNSIQSFVVSNDTLKANNYLSKFARLIRMFLDSSRARFITLEEEVELLQLYCEMEKLRFESKFDFEISVSKTLDPNLEIPSMIIQPFLENAINHGLRFKKSRGQLKVEFSETEDLIHCTITDDGIGREKASFFTDQNKINYKSQGLSITTERIATLNKTTDTQLELKIDDLYQRGTIEDIGTKVSFTFPKHID